MLERAVCSLARKRERRISVLFREKRKQKKSDWGVRVTHATILAGWLCYVSLRCGHYALLPAGGRQPEEIGHLGKAKNLSESHGHSNQTVFAYELCVRVSAWLECAAGSEKSTVRNKNTSHVPVIRGRGLTTML